MDKVKHTGDVIKNEFDKDVKLAADETGLPPM